MSVESHYKEVNARSSGIHPNFSREKDAARVSVRRRQAASLLFIPSSQPPWAHNTLFLLTQLLLLLLHVLLLSFLKSTKKITLE